MQLFGGFQPSFAPVVPWPVRRRPPVSADPHGPLGITPTSPLSDSAQMVKRITQPPRAS